MMKQNKNDAVEANQKMAHYFRGESLSNVDAANSDVETTNQKIQEEFYQGEKESYSLPFHIDINNPPIKK